MADVAGLGAAGYWSLDASDEEQQVVYVPGLSREENKRPASKSKTMRNEIAKANILTQGPAVTKDALQNWQTQGEQVAHEEGMKSASLKDLCPEDKRRIANLIKELARVSEEKEVTQERLKTEQESFEKKIRQLEEQNNLIITEREALQQQYRECQELLGLYQTYLSEQQEKLHSSLSELSAQGKRQTVCKFPPQPASAELNGSYLSQQCHKPSSESGSAHSFVMRHRCRSDPTSRTNYPTGPCNCSLENPLIQGKCSSATLPNLHFSNMTHCHQSHHSVCSRDHHLTAGNTHSTPARYPPELSPRIPPETSSFGRNSAQDVLGNGTGTRPKESACGKSVSEERKHELLLQKLELEIEKERLQQLLAQQEAKLLQKQHQLQQSRLDYQRTPEHLPLVTEDETKSSHDPRPLANGLQYSPARPSSDVVLTPPPSKGSKLRNSSRRSDEKKVVGFNSAQEDSHSSPQSKNGLSKVATKDAATSPTAAGLRGECATSVASPVQRGACRYETSLIDMLEAVSPISIQKPQPQRRDPYDFCISSPAPRSRHKASRQPVIKASRGQHPTDDPEESRILEEIFFIC